jgi:AmmeMemoRadiSam system protein B
MKNSQLIRKAMHAGSWYEANPRKLNDELNSYLAKADKTLPEHSRLRAIIGPHAGYRYSGPNAAWAYTNIQA